MNIKIFKRVSTLLLLAASFAVINVGVIQATPLMDNNIISTTSTNKPLACGSGTSDSADCSNECGNAANQASNCTTDCKQVNAQQCGIIKWLVLVINFLAAGVGIIVVTMIIIGGIEYTTSADNPQQVANARKKIINALLALVSFIFLYAFLNFIVPGGVL